MNGNTFQKAGSNKRSHEVMSRSSSSSIASSSRNTINTPLFTCQWKVNSLPCSETFPNPELLFSHTSQHIHEGSKQFPFPCKWGDCKKINHRKDHLISHIRVHIPYRPYKCQICGKAFKRSNDTREHERIHFKLGETQRERGRLSFHRSRFRDSSEDLFQGGSSSSLKPSRTDPNHSFFLSGHPGYQNFSSMPLSAPFLQPENSLPNPIHIMNNSAYSHSKSALNPNFSYPPPYLKNPSSQRPPSFSQSYSQFFSASGPPPPQPQSYYHKNRYHNHSQPKFQKLSYDLNSPTLSNENDSSPSFLFSQTPSDDSSSSSLPFSFSQHQSQPHHQPHSQTQTYSYSHIPASTSTPSKFLSKPFPPNNY